MKQRYFLNLLVYDLANEKEMVNVSYESTMLDEITSSMRAFERQLSVIQYKRDKDGYKIICEKPKRPTGEFITLGCMPKKDGE